MVEASAELCKCVVGCVVSVVESFNVVLLLEVTSLKVVNPFAFTVVKGSAVEAIKLVNVSVVVASVLN